MSLRALVEVDNERIDRELKTQFEKEKLSQNRTK